MTLGRRDALQVAAAAALFPPDAPARPPREGVASHYAENRRRRHEDATAHDLPGLTTAPPQTIGATPEGNRVTFPVIGGTFEGERLRGKVLPGGDDWTLKRPDGTFELDLRVTLETDDGALIHMTFSGIRNDALPYFRTFPRFETASPKYAFLNRLLAVGNGEIRADGPAHVIEEIV